MNDNKVAVITGAGAGIGRAIALGLARDHADIAVVDIAIDAAEETCAMIRDLGSQAIALNCNIMHVNEIEEMISKVISHFGRLDILVNNAGISFDVPIEELTEEQWDQMLDINLKGTFFCSKFAFTQMKKQGKGRIINIASIAGERGGLYAGAHYSASKAGVIVLAKCFAINGGCCGITANAVAPGTVETEMSLRLKQKIDDVPLGRRAKPEEVADAVCFLASDKASYISGMVLDVNGAQYMR